MFRRFDADWLIATLGKRKETRPLSKKMERLRSLNSIWVDLNRCSDAVRVINSSADSRHIVATELSDDASLQDAALGTLAVVLYARSTDTSSSRSSFDPRRFYSETQREWHASLIKLRNEAVAHFGSGRHRGGPWALDNLSLNFDSETNNVSFGYKYQRANYRGRVIAEIDSLLQSALPGIDADRAKLQASIYSDIEKVTDLFLEAIRECPVEEHNDTLTYHWGTNSYIPKWQVLED